MGTFSLPLWPHCRTLRRPSPQLDSRRHAAIPLLRPMEEHMPKVTVNGMQLAYTDTGTGTPFLFLPGTGGGKEYWAEYQVPFFSKHFRVITLDQRGIGESDRVEDHFETRDLANDAVAVLD